MGLFSGKVPERKWPQVIAALGAKMKPSADDWFKRLVDHNPSQDMGISSAALTHDARKCIEALQLAVCSQTIVEFDYVRASDVSFIMEALYIAMTSNPPDQFWIDIEKAPHFGGNDAQLALSMFSHTLAQAISTTPANPRLLAAINHIGVAIVITTKAHVCRAFGDGKMADKIMAKYHLLKENEGA